MAAYIKEGGLAPRIFILLVLLLFFSALVFTQPLPDKIRGYKVHSEKITVNSGSADGEFTIKFSDPALIEASLSGLTFELPAELRSAAQSGKVDFLSFHDFRVNGLSVEPEEYSHKFEFRRGETVEIPKPARVFLPTGGIIKAAWKEMHESKAEWTVTGRVFVFGRFRKLGFYHKRVVAIDFDIKIKNPINSAHTK